MIVYYFLSNLYRVKGRNNKWYDTADKQAELDAPGSINDLVADK